MTLATRESGHTIGKCLEDHNAGTIVITIVEGGSCGSGSGDTSVGYSFSLSDSLEPPSRMMESHENIHLDPKRCQYSRVMSLAGRVVRFIVVATLAQLPTGDFWRLTRVGTR